MTDRCCGLAQPHEGRCAFFCGGCIGTGVDLDARVLVVGIDPAGDVEGMVLCSVPSSGESAPRCPDCDGIGWFTDAGEPTYLSEAEYAAIAAACAAVPGP